MSLFGFDRLSGRDRRAVVMGLGVVVPAFAWVGVIRPYRGYVSQGADRIAAERSALERERELIESAPRIEHALEKARTRAVEAEGRLVRAAANSALAEAELVDYLETVAALSRVLLEEVRTVDPPRGAVAPAGLVPVRLAIRGESDLEGILSFLETVETNELLLRIHALTLEPVLERPERRSDDAPPAPARPTGVVEMGVVVEGYASPPDGRGSETGVSEVSR